MSKNGLEVQDQESNYMHMNFPRSGTMLSVYIPLMRFAVWITWAPQSLTNYEPTDIYRMRHVIHMPHSIYVSVTRQTNTNKKNYTHQLHHFQCKYRIRYAFCIIGHVAEDDFVFLTPHQLMHIGRRIGFTISRLISFYCLWCSCSLETMASLGSARTAGC